MASSEQTRAETIVDAWLADETTNSFNDGKFYPSTQEGIEDYQRDSLIQGVMLGLSHRPDRESALREGIQHSLDVLTSRIEQGFDINGVLRAARAEIMLEADRLSQLLEAK